MSDQEKKEQEIMAQEMSQDEMDTIAGGWGKKGCHDTVEGGNSRCAFGAYGSKCDSYIARNNGLLLYRPDGSVNCAATVEDGSHCNRNDACYEDEVVYLGMEDCAKAWK